MQPMKKNSMTKSKGLLPGVDIEGTKVAAGLVTADGKVLFSARANMVLIASAFFKSESALVGAAALCLPRTRLWNST